MADTTTPNGAHLDDEIISLHDEEDEETYPNDDDNSITIENNHHDNNENNTQEPEENLDNLKKFIETIFHNDRVFTDIPLRVRMQNHGGWISFSFFNHLKTTEFPNIKSWEKAIVEMNEMFEVKDQKFRRREMFPNYESVIYTKSILIVPSDATLNDHSGLLAKIKEIIANETLCHQAFYRYVHREDTVHARDISRLLHLCPSLRSTAFFWLEIQQAKMINDVIELLRDRGITSPDFSVSCLAQYVSQNKKALLSNQGGRQRGVTVSGDISGISNSKNRNSASFNSRFQFANMRGNLGGDGELDWSQLRGSPRVVSPFGSHKHLASPDAVAAAAQGGGVNNADNGEELGSPAALRSSSGQQNVKTLNGSTVYNNNATALGGAANATSQLRKPRRRLAFSESESGPVQPLHKHSADGVRPQFITRKTIPKSNLGNSNEGAYVTLIRQPRGPSLDGGFKVTKKLEN